MGPATLDLALNLTEAATMLPVGAATVDLIDSADLVTSLASGTTDANGDVVLSLAGPVSYPIVHSSAATYKDSYHFIFPVDASRSDDVLIVGDQSWGINHMLAGVTEDPAMGLIVGSVNVGGAPVAGATISVDTGGMVVYVAGGVPNATATATDASGQYVVFLVPPGAAVVSGMDATGAATGQITVDIFADSATIFGFGLN